MYRLLLLGIAVLMLVSCANEAAAPVTRQVQTVNGLNIGLEAQEQPKINTAQTIAVVLTDAQDQPVEGASVYFDLTMTTMPMGTNRPIAAEDGEGRYSTQSAYTMTGVWDITVFVEVNGQEYQAIFTRDVIE